MVAKSERTAIRDKAPPVTQEQQQSQQAIVHSNGGSNGHAVEAYDNSIPDFMRDYESSGRGVSEKAQDNLVPLAALLQPGRKEINKNETKYVQGAEAGMVLIPALTESPLIDCRKGRWGNHDYNANGMLVQVPFWKNGIAEWGVPRGSGFKGYHPLVNDNVQATMAKLGATQQKGEGDRMVWRNGNREFTETRQFTILLHLEDQDEHGNWRRTGEVFPVSLAFDSGEHTFAKDWNSQMLRRRYPNGQKADSWLGLWRLTSFYHQQGPYTWYKWRADWAGWVFNVTRDLEHVELGKTYYEAFLSGEKDFEAPTDDGGAGDRYVNPGVM